MNRKILQTISIVFLIACLPGTVIGQTVTLKESVLWRENRILLDVRLAREGSIQANTRYLLEAEVESLLPSLFLDALLDTPFDSAHTLGEKIKKESEFIPYLRAVSEQGQKVFSSYSADLNQVHLRYSFPFYGDQGLVVPFVTHTRPYPLRRLLTFEPSRTFTGVVIYAKGEYPAHGKTIEQRLTPSFFPKIYDQDMNLVLSAEMCEPEYLKRWGLVAYTDTLDEGPYLERIKTLPLRIVARGIFGRNATDVIIATDAAAKLLSREGNRQLLREGRILIIID